MDFIEQQLVAHPDLSDKYSKLGELFSKKLWHQLTSEVAAFVRDESNQRPGSFLGLYEKFISKFEAKLNQLEFAKIVGYIADTIAEPEESFGFFETVLERRNRLGVEATLYLEILLLLAKLRRTGPDGDRAETLASIQNDLETKRSEVDALQGLMDTCVHSAYYQLSTELFKEAGPPESYYKNALMLLAYTPIESMKPEQAASLATDMSLAALTGEGIYNFGEVLATPIVGVLDGSPNQWLGDLIRCFSRGDVEQFNMILEQNRDAYFSQPALKLRHEFLKEKLALMGFVNLVFETPSHERKIPFTQIASRVQLPPDQVEWLVMRSMSLGLVKGIMDQTEGVVNVDWVQPRVLDREQIGYLVQNLDTWAGKVAAASNFLQDETIDLV